MIKDFSPIDILDVSKIMEGDMGIMTCPSIQQVSDNHLDQMIQSERGLFERNPKMYKVLRVLSKEHLRYKNNKDKTIMKYLKKKGVIIDTRKANNIYQNQNHDKDNNCMIENFYYVYGDSTCRNCGSCSNNLDLKAVDAIINNFNEECTDYPPTRDYTDDYSCIPPIGI